MLAAEKMGLHAASAEFPEFIKLLFDEIEGDDDPGSGNRRRSKVQFPQKSLKSVRKI